MGSKLDEKQFNFELWHHFENLIAVYANTSTVIQSHSDVYPRQRDPFTEVLTEHLRFHVRACAEPHCKDVIGPAKKATESPRACIAFLVVLLILLPSVRTASTPAHGGSDKPNCRKRTD